MQLVVAVSLLAAAAASGPARRGMYVSLYREQPHQPHVFEYILGDAAKEDHLLAYCRRHGVNALTIYDGYPAMRQHAANLSAFVARARAVAGITTVEVAMSERTSFWDVLNAYQRNQPTVDAATGRLDGIVTEIEYWHDGDAMTLATLPGASRCCCSVLFCFVPCSVDFLDCQLRITVLSLTSMQDELADVECRALTAKANQRY